MACEKYTNCEYCKKDYYCPCDHMGMEVLGVKNFNAQ